MNNLRKKDIFKVISYEIFSNYTNHGHLGGFYNE